MCLHLNPATETGRCSPETPHDTVSTDDLFKKQAELPRHAADDHQIQTKMRDARRLARAQFTMKDAYSRHWDALDASFPRARDAYAHLRPLRRADDPVQADPARSAARTAKVHVPHRGRRGHDPACDTAATPPTEKADHKKHELRMRTAALEGLTPGRRRSVTS
jgi:hypothetical protein